MKSVALSIASLSFAVSAFCAAPAKLLPIDERISVDFASESRRTIVRNVADLYGLNVVLPSDYPDEKISVKLRNVNWREIYDVTFTASGYIYLVRGNIVLVVPRGDQTEQVFGLSDSLQKEIDENMKYREAIHRLLTMKSISREMRSEISVLVRDPHKSADELLKRLGNERPNQPSEPTSMSVTPPAAQEPRQP